MKFLEIPARDLRAHPLRSVLTSAGVAVAVASLIAFVGLSRGLERAWTSSLETKGTHIVAVRKGAVELLTASLDEELAARMLQVDGVAAVSGELGDLLELESGDMVFVAGWPLDSGLWRTLQVIRGDLAGVTASEGVVLGETLAGILAKQPGDTLQLGGRDFRVAAIIRRSSVLDERTITMALPGMQRLLGREGKVNGFHVRVASPEDPGEIPRMQGRLAAAFPALSFSEANSVAENNHITRLLRAIAWSCSSTALLMASAAVLNTLLMSVVQRTREIGLLSAVGWQPGRVMAMVVLEGLMLAAAGASVGILFGLGCLRLMGAHPKLGGLIQPEVTPGIVVEAAVGALLLGIVGSLYPAWRATRLNPVELLRGE